MALAAPPGATRHTHLLLGFCGGLARPRGRRRQDRHPTGYATPSAIAPKSICIVRPALPRLRSFDHCADALRVKWLVALVDVTSFLQSSADFTVA